jgi:hypothetical protein
MTQYQASSCPIKLDTLGEVCYNLYVPLFPTLCVSFALVIPLVPPVGYGTHRNEQTIFAVNTTSCLHLYRFLLDIPPAFLPDRFADEVPLVGQEQTRSD